MSNDEQLSEIQGPFTVGFAIAKAVLIMAVEKYEDVVSEEFGL